MTPSLHDLTALEAADAIKVGRMTAAAYAEGLLSRIEAHEDDVQAWQHLDPRAGARSGRAAGSPPRSRRASFGWRRRWRERHHRHRGYADRKRDGARCRPPAPSGCGGCPASARGGRCHHGQDRHDRACLYAAARTRNPRNLQPFAGRVLIRLGGGCRGGHGSDCDRNANEWLRDPAGLLLRRLCLEADEGAFSRRGRSGRGGDARYGRRFRALPRRRGRRRPSAGKGCKEKRQRRLCSGGPATAGRSPVRIYEDARVALRGGEHEKGVCRCRRSPGSGLRGTRPPARVRKREPRFIGPLCSRRSL